MLLNQINKKIVFEQMRKTAKGSNNSEKKNKRNYSRKNNDKEIKKRI